MRPPPAPTPLPPTRAQLDPFCFSVIPGNDSRNELCYRADYGSQSYDLSAGGRRYEFLPDRGGYNPVLDPPLPCSPLPHPESPPPPWTPSLPPQE